MKKSLRFIIAFLIVAGVAFGFYYYQNVIAKISAESVLPEGAILYARAINVEQNIQEFKASKFWQNVSSINYRKIFEKSAVPAQDLDTLDSVIKEISDILNSPAFGQFFGQEVAVAVTPVDVSSLSPKAFQEILTHVCLVTRLKSRGKLVESFGGLFQRFKKNPQIHESQYKKHKISSIDISELGGSVSYTVIKDVMVMGWGPRAAQTAIDVVTKGKKSLVEDAVYKKASGSFLENADKVGYGNMAYIVDTLKQQLNKFSAEQPARMREVYEAQMAKSLANVAGFQAFSFSSDYAPLTKEKFAWFFDKTKMDLKKAQLYSCAPKINNSLNLVPRSVMAYQWSACFDTTYYWESIKEKMMAEAAANSDANTPSAQDVLKDVESRLKLSIEKDVLPAFGDEFGGYLYDVDTTGRYPLPQLVFFVKIGNQAALDKVVDTLTAQPTLIMQNEDYNGVHIRSMSLPLGIKLLPAIGTIGDYFLLASDKDLLKKSIDAFQNPSSSLMEEVYFKEVNQGLTEANNSMFYLRMDQLSRKARDLAEWGYGFVERQAAQQKAFIEGSRKRKEDIEKGIAEKKAELEKMNAGLEGLKQQIAEATAQAGDVSTLTTQQSDVQIQTKAKEQAIDLANEQIKDIDELLAGVMEEKAADPAIVRMVLDGAVNPFLKGLESFPSIGSRARFLDQDQLESMVFIKVVP